MSPQLNAKNLKFVVTKYSNDIAGFAKDICGIERLDPWQEWLLEEMGKQDVKKIAIASCHSSGKTLLSTIIAIHRLVCYPEGRVLITSATEGQLKAAFGSTIAQVIDRSLIASWFDVSAEQIKLKGVENAWIRLRAWSKNRPESFAGIHCKSPLFIFDEASGIDASIFEAVSGSMMHENSKQLLLGNPLHRRGELFDAFTTKRQYYSVCNVSALDSSFISKDWIEEMADTYGIDSNIYRVRVLGEFPTEDIESFIKPKTVRDAINRDVITQHSEPIVAGLDVGRFKDASVLTVRQGHKVLSIEEFRTRESMTLSQLVSHSITEKKIEAIAVDANGIGAGVASRLRQIHGRDMIYEVSLSRLSIEDDKQYYNRRARLWGKMRDWLKYGSIPNNQTLQTEVTSLLYDFDEHGRYKLERKKDAAERGVGSPDFADSLAYTFAVNITQQTTKLVNNNVSVTWY